MASRQAIVNVEAAIDFIPQIPAQFQNFAEQVIAPLRENV
jgi:hypothetical protein